MLTYDLGVTQSFTVMHNSTDWRIATHTYDGGVNGIEAFGAWGIHETSEEAFLLQEGEGWLVTSREGQQAEDYAIRKLSETEMCVVEQGERHAVILKPGSRVLVVENRDMSNSRTEPVLPEIRRAAAAATR